MFYVGQKVVCVDDTPRSQKTYGLTRGRIYNVRGICENARGEVGLQLEEILIPEKLMNGDERGFYVDRFRPIQERKTDITVFTEILRKATRRKPATV